MVSLLGRVKVTGPDGSNYLGTQEAQVDGSDPDDAWLIVALLLWKFDTGFIVVHPLQPIFLLAYIYAILGSLISYWIPCMGS